MVQCCFHLPFVVFLLMAVLITQLFGLTPRERVSFETKRRLVEILTTNSPTTKEILPVVNNTTPVQVRIGFSLRQISTVDEVNQAVRLNVWLRLYWTNPFMTWDPKDHDNISSVHLDNELIWKPDIALYNKASLEEEIDILYKRLSTVIVLQNDGSCKWFSPATLLSQCKINVARFPFDKQYCSIIFGSWTYAAHEINVRPEASSASLDDFIENGEWKILEAPLHRNEKPYHDGISYPDVTLNLRIQRRPLYYTLNLIVPCTVISMLAFLSFVLPTNHGERVSLVITVLLAMSVYMLIVSSTLPQTSDAIPIIATYFLCIITEISLCLFATCFVAKLRDQESDIPKWFENFVNKKLASALLMRTTGHIGLEHTHEEGNHVICCSGHSKTYNLALKTGDLPLVENKSDVKEEPKQCPKQCPGLEKLSAELSVLADDVKTRQKHEMKLKKWRRAAEVIDRLFLVLFTIFFIVITCANFA